MKQDAALVATAITPDYALGGHTASLGLCWLPQGTLPGFPDGMAIGQHGSWNRSTLSGYKVVFVPFENGAPAGPPRDILSGFLAPDERVSYGRPVGVTIGPDGAVLVADDVGDVIWRVTGTPPGLILGAEPVAVAVGPLQQRGRDIHRQRKNHGIEQKPDQPLQRGQAAEFFGGDVAVGNLERHAQHEGEIDEVQIIRLFVLRKIDAAVGLVAAFVRG